MARILIVEDVALNIDLLTQLLEDEYEVLTAIDGRAAIEMARKEQPDLILMDLSLPVMDGWEATRRIRASEHPRRTPIIALTAHAMKGDEERARECGCDGYLTKPIDEDTLLDTVRKHLRR
jgi:CheY-like chemotaxis protein